MKLKMEKIKWTFSIVIAVVIIIAGVSGYFLTFSPSTEEENSRSYAVLGEPAPDFTVMSLDGEKVSLSDFRGNIVVLDFMATSCLQCKLEMEHLRQIHSKYSGEGVVLISVDIDYSESLDQIRRFKEAFGGQWLFTLDVNAQTGIRYQIPILPTVYIIDQDGGGI
ncbi:MAG: TlpA disulfide reductase family protein, partial [Candidatus Bathyarchaeota archaeon]